MGKLEIRKLNHCFRLLRILVTVVSLLGLNSQLMAADFSVAGIIESSNDHDLQPLSERHRVLLASMQQRLIMNDVSFAWHGAVGPCAGSVEIVDGTISGNGFVHVHGQAWR